MHTRTRAALLAASLFAAACSDSAPPTAKPSALASTPAPTSTTSVASCPTPAALVDELATANPGAALSLRGLGASCPGLRASATWTGGRLAVFSGTASGPSRLYEDAALGPTTSPTRVLFSATNAGVAPLRFAALLTNLGPSAGTLTLVRAGTASGPRRAVDRWLASSAAPSITIPPGATVRIDPLFTDEVVQPGAHTDGIWDYGFDRAHRLQLCAVRADGQADCSALPLAPRNGQVRGTFPWSERELTTSLDARAGAAHLPLTDVEERGVDALTGATVVLPNDVGVLRRVSVATRASGEPNVAVLLAARSPGAGVRASAGITPGGAVLLPQQLADSAGALVGTFAPEDGAVTLEYLATPDATPAELVAVPF